MLTQFVGNQTNPEKKKLKQERKHSIIKTRERKKKINNFEKEKESLVGYKNMLRKKRKQTLNLLVEFVYDTTLWRKEEE